MRIEQPQLLAAMHRIERVVEVDATHDGGIVKALH